jgi:hypothetical protein
MSTNKRDTSLIEIDISVQNNTLVVGVNGGNVTGVPGERVRWHAGDDTPPFTLQFYRLAAEPTARTGHGRIDVAALPRWPFTEPQPPGGVVGPTRSFTGTLMGNQQPPTAYKYSVAVQNLQLDPIVIVDR